ncbi:uncharacterized protein UTRI_06160 [Ustilago trichophora]|uniref:T6SS Phospholipase effector Tle1-like catalytic domain-containing protein n=1 Tax=Ustilago trichophora TaxID=86804 RepID=A0A5C3EI88_9BASI|nr:uncharacterized protein UTRI_06160 [Ustilago trichophora]
MIALTTPNQEDASGIPSLTTATPLPPPLQPRIPRAPIRIIVLCDGTAQQRNWVKTSLSKPSSHFHASSSTDGGDNGDKKRQKGGKSDPEPAADSGDFFTNVALLAKVIANSSGVGATSPPPSPTLGGSSSEEAKSNGAGAVVMPQIVFYQPGVGTGTGKIQNLFDQGTGLSLGSKIEEAYSFIVDNYQPGDELFLFGFSRGAYTARCISGLINWCGVLSKVEMTHFADIWAAYQRRDPDDIASEVAAAQVLYDATLRYPSAESEAIATSMYLYNLEHNSKLSAEQRKILQEGRRQECNSRRRKTMVVPPQIKVVGVWDTVSALGFPGMFQDNAMIDFFDFYDPGLGSNVQFGFHALSLEEDRKDFLPTMWYQPSVAATPSAAAGGGGQEFGVRGKHMRTKQVLKQTWFQGVHTDCGGGYQYHGLSDITLIWMVSQLVDPHILPDGSTTLRPLLNIDLPLLATILDRRREWAMQLPHRSRPTINYQHPRTVRQRQWDSETMKRTVWANMAKTGRTNETIHPSVPRGGRIDPKTHPAFAEMRIDDAAGLEQMWKEAQDWENGLRPTEKLLYWNERGPYPFVPNAGDVLLNPATAPLVVTGGWNIPEMARGKVREAVVAAAEMQSGMGDVDEAAEENGVAFGNGNGANNVGVDVDEQPLDGWGEDASSTRPTASKPDQPQPIPTITNPTNALNIPTPPPATLPLIPSKELGENPVDPLKHPHLFTLWQNLYNLASTPNAILADVINLSLVPKTNLNQTLVQGWIWELGDKIAGYGDEVKVQALTAGMVHDAKCRNGRKGKKLNGKGKAKLNDDKTVEEAQHDL